MSKEIKCRWVKMPPIKEGYEIVHLHEAADFLEDEVVENLTTHAMIQMAGLILIKEKEE